MMYNILILCRGKIVIVFFFFILPFPFLISFYIF